MRSQDLGACRPNNRSTLPRTRKLLSEVRVDRATISQLAYQDGRSTDGQVHGPAWHTLIRPKGCYLIKVRTAPARCFERVKKLAAGCTLNGASPLRPMSDFGNPYPVAFCVFNGPLQFVSNLTSIYMKRVQRLLRHRRKAGNLFSIRNIENEKHWSHRPENDDRPRSCFNLSVKILHPSTRRSDKTCARHLCVNEHRIKWRVKPESRHEFH